MHLLIWFVRSTVENAISTAVVGLVYSPIFPGVLSLANEVFPPEAHLVSMAMMYVFSCLAFEFGTGRPFFILSSAFASFGGGEPGLYMLREYS